jgi:hypothetical protein
MRIHFKLATLSLCLYHLSGCNSYVTQTNFDTHQPRDLTTINGEYPYADKPYMYAESPYVYYGSDTIGRGVSQQYIGNATPTLYPSEVKKVNNYPSGRHISEAMPPKIAAVNAPPYQYNSMGYTEDATYNAMTPAPSYESFREQTYPSNNEQTYSANNYVPSNAPVTYNSSDTTYNNTYTPTYVPSGYTDTVAPTSVQQQSGYNMYNYNQQNMLLETMAATSMMSMMSTPTAIPPHLDPNKSQDDLNDAIETTSYENTIQNNRTVQNSYSNAKSAPRSLLTNTKLSGNNTPALETKGQSNVKINNISKPEPTSTKAITSVATSSNDEDVQVITKETKVASLNEEAMNEEIKRYDPDTKKMWTAHSGDDLQNLLTSWAKEAGWHVVWKTDRKYNLAAGAKMKGKFINVSSALVRAFARARPAPRAVYYRGNKVLLITTMDDDNAE